VSKGIAIVAVTERGVALGRRLKQLLPANHLYLPQKLALVQKPGEYPFSSPAREAVRDVFRRYRQLVLVMAVGIAVRLVAPELKDKRKDPGVVVVDDAGLFSVSLLSGHEGGANELARKIASLIGASAVVTTASEVSKTASPKNLVLGIGCNRGTKALEIEEAVAQVFSENGLSLESIRSIATIDIKKNEGGLLGFARKYRLPIDYFNKEALSKVKSPRPSAAVLKHVGTPAVCEAAALLSSSGSLIVPKVSHKRAVTIAVAARGKLFLVGIGPGELEQMTFKAREAINQSEVVVGYKNYIKLIEPYISHKEVIATGMGAEVERVKTAISLAEKGGVVSLVSSGDSGIYGMAGLVGEVLGGQGGDIDIELVAGVPLLVASATLLGAPISGDFASISLSDYLVPWEEIARRLELAARGNFVIVLYNPRSRKRRCQLTKAREIILKHRPPSTPVGITTNAYREEQEVVVTDLEHMLDYEIDMNTTVIVGNSATFNLDGWMVTPRGYKSKYDLTKEQP
jgi:cobalt-precorrin 5A hydrolase/precorrin-3B C17-methyltransferase